MYIYTHPRRHQQLFYAVLLLKFLNKMIKESFSDFVRESGIKNIRIFCYFLCKQKFFKIKKNQNAYRSKTF